MEKSWKEQTVPEKIGTVLAFIIMGVVLFTIFSKDLTFADIINWLFQAAGWYIFAAIAIPIVGVLLFLLFLKILPFLLLAMDIVGVWLILSGTSIIIGIILLVVSLAIFGWYTGFFIWY